MADPAAKAVRDYLSNWQHPDVRVAAGLDEGAGAAFSTCERYRYLLWRVWNPALPFWAFGMLNPSTADHLKLDPTITRCCKRAMAGGAGGLIVWNLFAWRATDPADMKRAADPVGRLNNLAMARAVQASALTIAGWGAHGSHLGRDAEVRRLLAMAGEPLHALAFTADGRPRHPLYLASHLKPEPWAYWEKAA